MFYNNEQQVGNRGDLYHEVAKRWEKVLRGPFAALWIRKGKGAYVDG